MKPFAFSAILSLAISSVAVSAQEDGKANAAERAKFLEKAAAKAADALPAAGTPSTPVAPAAAPAAGADVPAQMVSDFFVLVQKGQIDEAYSVLTKGSKTIQSETELKVLKQKTREAIESFGAFSGFELVETKPVGTKLLRRTYLSLGAEFPLRWRFYFYTANNRWRLIDMRVDDRLTGLFDEPREAGEEARAANP